MNKETGESYVGSTVNLNKRFAPYYPLRGLEGVLSRSKSHILSAIQKYGHSNFRLEILEYCDPADLIKREQFYIDSIKPEYNILLIAGSSLGVIPSEETKMKISKTLKARWSLLEQKMSIPLGSKVEVLNVDTNETTLYPSNRRAAIVLGCSEFTIRYYIKNKKLYNGKYLLKKLS